MVVHNRMVKTGKWADIMDCRTGKASEKYMGRSEVEMSYVSFKPEDQTRIERLQEMRANVDAD